MIDPKKIKPGVWFNKANLDGPEICIVLWIEQRRKGEPWVHYWSLTGGFEHSRALSSLAQQGTLMRRQQWHVTKPSQINKGDYHVLCGCSRDGRKLFITAGCQFFDDLDDAEHHWTLRHRDWMDHRDNKRLNNHRLGVIRKFRTALKRRRAK